ALISRDPPYELPERRNVRGQLLGRTDAGEPAIDVAESVLARELGHPVRAARLPHSLRIAGQRRGGASREARPLRAVERQPEDAVATVFALLRLHHQVLGAHEPRPDRYD